MLYPFLRLFPKAKTPAFTLVEILVVISIIGLLAGLGFPAIQGAIQAGKKAEVAAMSESIKTAIHAYYAEYMRFPADEKGVVFSNTDNSFFNLMLGTNSPLGNPRQISFLEIPPKFTNSLGVVTPSGFYKGGVRTNFNLRFDTQGVGFLNITVGSKRYSNPASVAVWVPDPRDSNKPVGTFR